ncbi:MAG: DNA-3-methyladenine glycosylase I [Melioribacteraceae bacterium]
MTNYREIFEKVELSLKNYSSLSESDFEDIYGRFKFFENKKLSDDEYFENLIMIIFYSGFRASTVSSKEKIILRYFSDYKKVSQYSDDDFNIIFNDSDMIKNERKIKSCIKNAATFRDIVIEYKSFKNYIDSFNANQSFEKLILLKEELEYRFEYLGGTTVYHFLTDIGFNVLKPDRVILRIFKRLGLIESEKQLLKTVIQGRLFAKATELPIRYIDIIFVRYGQQGVNEYFGLNNGICLETSPNCNVCGINEYCNYKYNILK